ncbi:MAG: hypothetical protein R6U32_06570 [Candidatus Woesearchaeota archaeon]
MSDPKKEIKDAYEALKDQYSLPAFDELDREFEISSIDHSEFILREIRRKMDDKTESFIKILNVILQPETTISELQECKQFSDEEKEKMFGLYKRLMLIHNTAALAGIECDDRKDAEFISSTFREWQGIKKQMITIAEKIKDAWKDDADISDIKDEIGYLG